MLKKLIVMAIIFMVVGCAGYSGGRDISAEQAYSIVKGKTTTDQLLLQFGQPSHKMPSADGGERWFYSRYSMGRTSLFTAKSQSKSLNIILKNGIVENYTFTEQECDQSVLGYKCQ